MMLTLQEGYVLCTLSYWVDENPLVKGTETLHFNLSCTYLRSWWEILVLHLMRPIQRQTIKKKNTFELLPASSESRWLVLDTFTLHTDLILVQLQSDHGEQHREMQTPHWPARGSNPQTICSVVGVLILMETTKHNGFINWFLTHTLVVSTHSKKVMFSFPGQGIVFLCSLFVRVGFL